MAVPLLPTLQGMGYPVTRTPIWSHIPNKAISGKRAPFSLWNYPQYRYSVPFQFLRNNSAEFQVLLAFYNDLSGAVGLFQFNDPDDNTATSVEIGIGDGNTTTFQLYTAIYDPVFAVTGSPVVALSGVTVSNYTLSSTGVVTFNSAPSAGASITWSGTYNWYCRFDEDSLDFEKWISTFYRMKAITFTTEKYLQ